MNEYQTLINIGAGLTNGSAQWTKFIQNGDDFTWETPVSNYSGGSGAGLLQAVTVPIGRKIKSFLIIGCLTGGQNGFYISDPDVADITPVSGNISFATNGGINNTLTVYTNTSGQIRHRSLGPSVGTLLIITQGWTDQRGKNS